MTTTAKDQMVIVCATDFSEESASAVDWTQAFARGGGAQIELVHVLPAPTRNPAQLATDERTYEAARLEEAQQRIGRTARELEGAGVSVHGQILTGDADVEIVALARRRGAKLIVVGACGRSTIERWMLGSVAERTVRSANIPVVVVPRREAGRPWFPATDGAAAKPLAALVALAGDDVDALVAFTSDLRRRRACDVTFLHLYWPPEEFARLGLRGRRDALAPDPDVVRNLDARLRPLLGGLAGQGKTHLEILPAWGEPAANLLLAAGERPCDLLIVGSHERHALSRTLTGTVGERLATRPGPIPVVCVPAVARPPKAAPQDRPIPRLLTVLAPTDLSELGNAAVPHAYSLLRATGGVVEICYVHQYGLPRPAFAYESPGRLTEVERAAIEERLRALVPAEAAALGISTHITVIDGGEAAEVIVQTAERMNVDAISLGSHGRGGLGAALLGSVAQDVVRRANRPVLVVRARSQADA